MAADFTKFPFARIVRPDAATLTEAITADPVSSGFVVMTVKAAEPPPPIEAIGAFANAARTSAFGPGLVDITAYRQLHRDELGGAVPFDQPICESIVAAASRHRDGIGARAMASALRDPFADWLILLEYRTPDMASQAATRIASGADASLGEILQAAAEHTVGAFKNMKRYSSVSQDPNVIQFFNLFDAPGDLEVLWSAWQDALPWFFEIAEFRSSFPLLALDPAQPFLLINRAHLDSTKHFLNGALHDPALEEVVQTCYIDRHVTMPAPFFCKIVHM